MRNGGRSKKEPGEVQAEFLEGAEYYAFIYNNKLMRLMTAEEMAAAVHLKCGDAENEWIFTPTIFHVESPSGNVFKFEKLL